MRLYNTIDEELAKKMSWLSVNTFDANKKRTK